MADQEMPVCVGCDCVDDNYTWTVAGRGPFCHECWENITDPDSILFFEESLTRYEHEVECLKDSLSKAEEALRESVIEVEVIKSLVWLIVEAVEAGNAWPDGVYEHIRDAVSQ